MEERVTTYTLTFLPDDKSVTAAAGSSLLQVAADAGIPLNNVCGGNGACGKCRLKIRSGKVKTDPDMSLDDDERQAGVVLACRADVAGDATIEVPPETRRQEQLDDDSDSVGVTAQARPVVSDVPLVQKQACQLPIPTLDDCISDQERLSRALGESASNVHNISLRLLRQLPSTLRESNFQVTLLTALRRGGLEILDVEPGDTASRNFGLAVDVGTTTVVARLVDLNSGESLGLKGTYNSQAKFGADVIARMMHAESSDGTAELRDLVVSDINGLIGELTAATGVEPREITAALCSGNTTMSHLLLGIDPTYIRKEPYVPSVSNPPFLGAAEVGIEINPAGIVALTPAVASYVGGDVVADVLACGMHESSDLSLLIDLGTNGELVLGNSDWLMCCAASAGPSFEGGGISSGMRAGDGAIEGVILSGSGAVKSLDVIGGGKPQGICGSGLIDLIGELVRVESMDRKGRFVSANCGDQLRPGTDEDHEYLLIPGTETAHGRDIVITEADISNLIHSKGSIYMAAECLLDYMSLDFTDIQNVYIAGGLGSSLGIEQAIRIGLLPDIDRDRFAFIGNGSVHGAHMGIMSQSALQTMSEKIADRMTYIELSTNHKYMNGYSSCLFLPHTDLDKFPSVQQNSSGCA